LEAAEKGLEAGVAILDSGIVAGADGPLVRLERGTARIQQGLYAEAEEDLRLAHRADPADGSIALNLAACLVRRGADAQADELLLNPRLARDPIALYYRGLLRLRAGEWEKAAALLDASLVAGATDHRPSILRAMAWIRCGRLRQAENWLDLWLGELELTISGEDRRRFLDLLASEPMDSWVQFRTDDPEASQLLQTLLRGIVEAWNPVRSS
jgi:tetratricopeptide (TPR) repeat protein